MPVRPELVGERPARRGRGYGQGERIGTSEGAREQPGGHVRPHARSRYHRRPGYGSFASARLEEGKAAGTVNRDLGVLRRMFILGMQSGKLGRRPHLGS